MMWDLWKGEALTFKKKKSRSNCEEGEMRLRGKCMPTHSFPWYKSGKTEAKIQACTSQMFTTDSRQGSGLRSKEVHPRHTKAQ